MTRRRIPLRSSFSTSCSSALHEQLHQQADLFRRAAPVLGTEGEQRQVFDAALETGAHHLAHRLDTPVMPGDARHKALLRPAPVAVHDDRDMARHAPPRRGTARVELDERAMPRICAGVQTAISSASFWREQLVDFGDVPVGQLLDFVLRTALVVLRALLVLEHPSGARWHRGAGCAPPPWPSSPSRLDHLDQVAAALFGQRRHRHADQVALRGRIEAEIGIADRLLDLGRPCSFPRAARRWCGHRSG